MQKTQTKRNIAALFLAAGTLTASTLQPARAVVLQQKFVAGQSDNYTATLSGTLKLNASDRTPVPWAGLPLEVPLAGDGQLAFDTLAAGNDGNATVRLRLPQAKLTALAFGMSAVVTAQNGVGTLSLNGTAPKTFPLPFLVNPPYALNVSPTGRVLGVSPTNSKPSATNASATNASATDASATDTSLAKSRVTLTGSSTRDAVSWQKWLAVMPDIWPNRDVKPGETWTIAAKMPLANAPGGVLDLGTIGFKLLGEEVVSGVALQHIAVSGNLALDANQTALLNAAMPKNVAKGTAQIVSDRKSVSGDLWFDANAGRLARASLKVAAANAFKGTTKPDAQGKSATWNSAQSFDGTVEMLFAGAAAIPAKTSDKAAAPRRAS